MNSVSGAAYYTITPKVVSTVTTNDNNGVITAGTTAGTETYVISLYSAAGALVETKDTTVTVVDATKITEFAIGDLNKFYTGANAGTDYNQTVTVNGVVGGKKVVINQAKVKDFDGVVGLNASTGVFSASTDVTVLADTDGADKTATLKVLVEAGDNTYSATKEVKYSDAVPAAVAITVNNMVHNNC